MTGVIANLPKFQFFDNNGHKAAGYKLYTYDAGTTTPATTWQDKAQTAANTNPIVLDSRGECNLWLDSTKEYKFVLTTDTGTVVWTQDNVSGMASSGGGSSGDFIQAGTGAVTRTAQDKMRDIASLKDFGAVGDGTTSDQTAVVNAIASGFKSVRVNDGSKCLVTSLSNPLGVEWQGDGAIVKAIPGGVQKLNSYADRHKYVFGREYLAAFHNLLISQTAAPTRKPIMVFSGDSTTAGDSASADYKIDVLLKKAGEAAGLQTSYGLSSINRGQSGKNTEQWRTGYLADDLALNPDLLVLRWGINDPGYLKDGTTPPLDAGQSYPNRRDVNDFITSLRSALATIRASRSVGSLSIVLMTPNSTADTPNGRDELWYEAIAPGIKQAARDYLCTFVDTYAYLRDSRPAASAGWMDDPFGDGRGIHPLNVMNTWIAGLMADVIFPRGLREKIGKSGVRNIAGADDAGDATRLPSYYDYGITVSRASNLGGFPIDGSVATIRSADETVMQILYPFKNADLGTYYLRFGRSATLYAEVAAWGAWVSASGGGGGSVTESTANVTSTAGFTYPASGQMRVAKTGSMCVAEGFMVFPSPSTVVSNNYMGTVPAGYRPVREAVYGKILTFWDGASFQTVLGSVTQAGDIYTREAVTIVAQRFYLNASWSLLA